MTGKPKILVVEDHPDVLHMMVFLLKRAGCNVVTAQTGVQGLEIARDGDFDLITLDIDLPGISGLDICRHLKQDPALRQTPVIFISGRSCDEDIHHGLALGAVDYISKPFDVPAFVPRILSHIKAKTKKQNTPTCLSL